MNDGDPDRPAGYYNRVNRRVFFKDRQSAVVQKNNRLQHLSGGISTIINGSLALPNGVSPAPGFRSL